MIIDTSAVLAILLEEPEEEDFLEMVANADVRMMSAASVLETGIVLEGRNGEAAGREFDLFVNQAKIEVIPVDLDQVETARIAWRKYGKGRHPAALNFGDCFAYALAKVLGEPLLAKGRDFPQTDILMCKKDI
jgi:ribonuclease VapC